MATIHLFRDRLHVWREIAWSRWKAAVMTLYGVVCALEFARDHWASDALKAKLRFVPNLTWQGWTIGALALLVIATLEGAYHAVRTRDSLLDSERQAALVSASAGDSGRDELMVLVGQLSQFLDARRDDYNSQFDPLAEMGDNLLDSLDASPFGGKRARERQLMKERHNSFTLQAYGDRFASRVVAATRKLLELGVAVTETAHLRQYPRSVADVDAIISELKAASVLIPSVPNSDLSALYQANTLLKNEVAELRAISAQRHLNEDKQRTIAQVVRTGLRDLWNLHRASQLWTSDDKEGPISVQLYTMENDRETIRYRDDFAKALQAGGLSVHLGEFLGTSGAQENDQFIGTVSLVNGDPKNLVRPFILDALRSAGVAVNECEDWPRSQTTFDHARGDYSSAATLIIGQRR